MLRNVRTRIESSSRWPVASIRFALDLEAIVGLAAPFDAPHCDLRRAALDIAEMASGDASSRRGARFGVSRQPRSVDGELLGVTIDPKKTTNDSLAGAFGSLAAACEWLHATIDSLAFTREQLQARAELLATCRASLGGAGDVLGMSSDS